MALVWSLFAIVAVEILVTYSRLPASELYHVSGSGLRGGASRALVFLNFPLALVSIAIAAFLYPGQRTWRGRALAIGGVALAGVVFWPGVVKESDLDARWINVLPAIGVGAILALTVATAAGSGHLAPSPVQSWDRVRLVVAAAVLILAVPWLAAELGLFFNGSPVLGTLYQSGELRSLPHTTGLHPAVHHGHHHGMDGTLLVLSALLLSRLLSPLAPRGLRLFVGGYLALMLCYGAGNIANDFWIEQVVKRGWTGWQIPEVTTPAANGGWAVIVAGAAVLWIVGALTSRRDPGRALPTDVETH
jgi:hypothetical protein